MQGHSTPSSSSNFNNANYLYQYNYSRGTDSCQQRQLYRIWETGPDGVLVGASASVKSNNNNDQSSTRHMFLDVFLPNGLLLPIQCPTQRTLALLKQDVFIQARKYPLGNRLSDISNYVFATVGLDGTHLELYDEQKTVSSLQFLFLPILLLHEPDGNKTEKELCQSIGLVMGIPLAELEKSMSDELYQYRIKLFETCCEAEKQRGTHSFMHYAFPEEPLLAFHPAGSARPHFENTDELNETDLDYGQLSEQPSEVEQRAIEKLRRKMQFSDAYVEVWYGTKGDGKKEKSDDGDGDGREEQFKHSVHIRNVLEMTPEGVVQAALREFRSQHGLDIAEQPSDFILQIAGRRVFITRRNVFLTQFDYIRSCFENYRIPRLILRLKKLIFRDYSPPPKIFEPSYVRRERHNKYLKSEATKTLGEGGASEPSTYSPATSSSNPQQSKRFWDLEDNLKLRINSASHITVQDSTDRLFIRVAVAVGRHVLDVRDSCKVSPSNPRWQDVGNTIPLVLAVSSLKGSIEFNVYMKDLPESAQLCFSLISVHCPQASTVAEPKAAKQKGQNQQQPQHNPEHLNCLGWSNLRLFDWRNRFLQGKQTLYLRPFSKGQSRSSTRGAGTMSSSTTEASLQFLQFGDAFGFGGSSSGTGIPSTRSPRLEIEMHEYFGHSVAIEYPSDSVIQKYINWLRQQRRPRAKSESGGDEDEWGEEEEEDAESEWEEGGATAAATAAEYGTKGRAQRTNRLVPGNPNLERILRLRRCLDSAELSEDDQRFLWRARHKICRLFPQMLTVLADCALIWRDRETTSEFYHLLGVWPALQVDTAIELLDGRYVDGRLRAMAIRHLDSALDNDQLQLYLLILVQAIHFESHAYTPLVQMLLRRALMDYRVGHTLFWLLRAELAHLLAADQAKTVPSTSTEHTLSSLFARYALLLEAYCRGNSGHLKSMIKQVEMISTLTALSAQVRAIGNRDAAIKKLQHELLARKEAMQHMVSPVNATDRLGELIVEECRVLSSAKQPLLLTWRNPECLAHLTNGNHQLIFKCGDDLRQDMLALHVMRIMDAKWKCQLQQDYCTTLYEVLPMGKNIGLIHVVPDCQTLFQIQCETKRKYAGSSLNMDVSMLNKYIYKKCCASDSKKYLECVDRFTFSLAGYCVATYVLGIKDRHQDNIMLVRDGRIFHIDFGHFLGHTKRKLGINRERTDFVLTDHFLYVISRGKGNFRQTYEYNSFREECVKGFLVLHNQARFFIALFRMMCCMGLPELNSPENVDFLRQSLMYEKVEREEARAAFQQVFDDVVKGDWSVQLNWFFHSVRHM